MSSGENWVWWIVAALVAGVFVAFFLFVGRELLGYMRSLVSTIQNWPQTRRAMVEAEARAGGRYPLWFRAIRVSLVLAAVGLAAVLIWRRFTT